MSSPAFVDELFSHNLPHPGVTRDYGMEQSALFTMEPAELAINFSEPPYGAGRPLLFSTARTARTDEMFYI
jgi:hypothetical protein